MKTQNPWMGRVRGSAGNMTGCKVYDKNVLRAKAFEVANPNTPAQQVQRNFFKQLSALVATFNDDELRTLFPQKPKAMSRRNAIAKQMAVSNDIVNGEKVIDFSDITTLGNARTMDFGTTTCSNSSGTITITLDNAVKANTVYQPYCAIAAIVNETKGEIYLTLAGATVETGTWTVSAPTGWENADTIHAIPFITDVKGNASALTGFGSFIIKTRPEKAA